MKPQTEQAVDTVCNLIADQESVSKLKLRLAVGEAIVAILESGEYSKPNKAAMKVSDEVHRRTGHFYSYGWFRRCYDYQRKLTPEQIKVLQRKRVPVTYIDWMLYHHSKETFERMMKAIRRGDNTAPFRVPAGKKKSAKATAGGEGVATDPADQVVFQTAKPIDAEMLTNAAAALQSIVPRSMLEQAMNEGAQRSGNPLWVRKGR